mmetsp:Transcript_14564/g.40978  ORF Transcript_14564/g.40978 Transcript_14564/m.40978 type:complete len:89 (+) Transcript_14564:123-389(+)
MKSLDYNYKPWLSPEPLIAIKIIHGFSCLVGSSDGFDEQETCHGDPGDTEEQQDRGPHWAVGLNHSKERVFICELEDGTNGSNGHKTG